jgi:Yip1 domain
MPEAVIQPESSALPLSQGQRVVDTFIAPSKTFTDILRSSSWWLPWLIGLVVTLALGFAIQQKIGWDKVYDNILRQSPSQQKRMDQVPADQQAKTKAIGTAFTKGIFWAAPVIGLVVTVIMAAVLMATVNFGFGGRSKFGHTFAVLMYGSLPVAIKALLGIVTIYAGVDPDSFNIKNYVGTNIGYYLPLDMPKWLIALGTSLDVFTIWMLVLLTIGCAIIGKISRGKAAGAVFGWWAIAVLIGMATAGIGG